MTAMSTSKGRGTTRAQAPQEPPQSRHEDRMMAFNSGLMRRLEAASFDPLRFGSGIQETASRLGVDLNIPEDSGRRSTANALTQNEMRSLVNANTDKAWESAAEAIRAARKQQYPSDWFEFVLRSGLMGIKETVFAVHQRESTKASARPAPKKK